MQINDVYKDNNGNLVTVTRVDSQELILNKSETLLIPEFLLRYTPWKDYIEVRRKLAELPVEYMWAAYDEYKHKVGWSAYKSKPKESIFDDYWYGMEEREFISANTPTKWKQSLIKRVDDFQDLIDWDSLPDEAVCVGCNADNKWFWSNTKDLTPSSSVGSFVYKEKYGITSNFFQCNLIPLNWHNSLTMRLVKSTDSKPTDEQLILTKLLELTKTKAIKWQLSGCFKCEDIDGAIITINEGVIVVTTKDFCRELPCDKALLEAINDTNCEDMFAEFVARI